MAGKTAENAPFVADKPPSNRARIPHPTLSSSKMAEQEWPITESWADFTPYATFSTKPASR